MTSLLLAGGLLLVGPVAAYSSMFGSLAVFIPALFFALVVYSRIGADSGVFLGTTLMAIVAKIFLTIILCVAVFVWVKPLAVGWFFTGMAVGVFSGQLGQLYRA